MGSYLDATERHAEDEADGGVLARYNGRCRSAMLFAIDTKIWGVILPAWSRFELDFGHLHLESSPMMQ